jgi:hypothetical protein
MNERKKALFTEFLHIFIYSAVLFALAYFMTLILVIPAHTFFPSASIEMLSYTIGTAVFILLAGAELLLTFKGVFWTPITVAIVIPFIVAGIIKAILQKTTYIFDVRNPPEKIKKLKGVFIVSAYMNEKQF